MLGPIGANLINIFKVLTPSEIDIYSEIRTQSSVKAVAVGAENINYESDSGRDPYTKRHEKIDTQPDGQEGESTSAKIIPLNQEIAKAIEQQHDFHKVNSENHINKPAFSNQNDLSSIGILSAYEQQKIEEEKREQEKRKRDSSTVFLLNERNKLRKSRMLLSERNALYQYQKNSTVEIINKTIKLTDEEEEQEHRDSASKGILVNKKHY